jgi:hypothetical protein
MWRIEKLRVRGGARWDEQDGSGRRVRGPALREIGVRHPRRVLEKDMSGYPTNQELAGTQKFKTYSIAGNVTTPGRHRRSLPQLIGA